MLITHLHLLPGLGMSGAVPLLSLHVLNVYKGTNLPVRLLAGFEHGIGPDFQDFSATDVVPVL